MDAGTAIASVGKGGARSTSARPNSCRREEPSEAALDVGSATNVGGDFQRWCSVVTELVLHQLFEFPPTLLT